MMAAGNTVRKRLHGVMVMMVRMAMVVMVGAAVVTMATLLMVVVNGARMRVDLIQLVRIEHTERLVRMRMVRDMLLKAVIRERSMVQWRGEMKMWGGNGGGERMRKERRRMRIVNWTTCWSAW